MYEKMLVPLDGSRLAECVLPHARAIAKGCTVREIILLRVVEPPPTMGAEGIDVVALQQADQEAATAYLARIESQLAAEGFKVSSHVLAGRAAEAINEFVHNNEVNLIALATHGRSGISRLVFGSVADRVIRSAHVPVLLVRPKDDESAA